MISGVKCRTRRALDFRTHIAASGLSRGFVCLRVGMKLNTLYKSVQSSMPLLLYSSDSSRHQTTSFGSAIITFECVLSVTHWRHTARTLHVPPCLWLWPTLKTCHSLRAYVELVVNGGRTDWSFGINPICRPQIKRDYPLNLSI